MLELIRSSAQSFWVKVAFGVIILVFVFWGVGNFNDRDYSNVVAVVNGQPIVALEFERAYLDTEEYLLRNNPGLTREQLEKEHLGRRVLNELIQQTLLEQEAERAGVRVMPEEMRMAVSGIKAFQDENGKFDPEAYKRVVAARRMSVADYEKGLASQLLRDKMFELVTASAWVDPDEARHRFDFIREKRVIDYIFVPSSRFEARAQVTDEDIKKWYEGHQADFEIPARINVEYISVNPAALVDKKSIPEQEARDWYEKNLSRYARPEQIRASHILVPVPLDADEEAVKEAMQKLDEAREQLAQGKKFEEVADAVNPAGAAEKGGDLGWLKRGETVPEFENLAFDLEVGKVSEPVRTPFGLHLVMVTEKRPQGTASFEEAAEDVYNSMALEKGQDKLPEVLDTLIEENILMKPLAEAAARYQFRVEKTGLVDAAALMEKLKLKEDAVKALMETAAGSPVDTALEAGDNYIIARVDESVPAGVKPLEDVSSQIAGILKDRASLELAMQEAAKMLERVRGETLAEVRQQYPELKTADPLDRAGSLAGFAPNDALMRAIFSSPLQAWLPQAFEARESSGPAGALIAYVDKVIAADGEEFANVSRLLDNAARQQRKEGIYSIFLEKLFRNADIRLANQNIVDRTGA